MPKSIQDLYQDLLANLVNHPETNCRYYAQGDGAQEYPAAALTQAKTQLSQIGLTANIARNASGVRVLTVTCPLTRFRLVERAAGQVELSEEDEDALNESALQVILVRRSNAYVLHFNTGTQGRHFVGLVDPQDAPLIALLNAQGLGGIVGSSALGRALTQKVRQSGGVVNDFEAIFQGKIGEPLVNPILEAYRDAARTVAAAAPRAVVPADLPQTFDIGFDETVLSHPGLTRDQAYAALLACLRPVGESFEIDSAKRARVVMALLSRSEAGDLTSRTFPLTGAGNIAIVTNTYHRSHTLLPQSEDTIGSLPSDLRVVVFERTNVKGKGADAKGTSSGVGFPGGLSSEEIHRMRVPLSEKAKKAAIAQTQAKLASAQGFPVQALREEFLTRLDNEGIDFSYLTKMLLASPAELQRLRDQRLISDAVFAHVSNLARQTSIGLSNVDAIKIAVSASFQAYVEEKDLTAIVANDTRPSAPMSGIHFTARILDLNRLLYRQIWFYAHEFYGAMLPLLYHHLPADRKKEDFIEYLKRATRSTMELMQAHILEGHFPSQVSLAWPAAKIFTTWSNLVRIDFRIYLKDYPTLNPRAYAQKFGLEFDELEQISENLRAICTGYMAEFLPLIEAQKVQLRPEQLRADLIPGAPIITQAQAANLELDLLLDPIGMATFAPVLAAALAGVAPVPVLNSAGKPTYRVTLLPDGYCYAQEGDVGLDRIPNTLRATSPLTQQGVRIVPSPMSRAPMLVSSAHVPRFEALCDYLSDPGPRTLQALCTDGLFTLCEARGLGALKSKITQFMVNPVMLVIAGDSHTNMTRYRIVDAAYADMLRQARIPETQVVKGQTFTQAEVQILQTQLAQALGVRSFDPAVIQRQVVVNFADFIAANQEGLFVARAAAAGLMTVEAPPAHAAAVEVHLATHVSAQPREHRTTPPCAYMYQNLRDLTPYRALVGKKAEECTTALAALIVPGLITEIEQGRLIQVVYVQTEKTIYLIARAQVGGVKVVPVTLDRESRDQSTIEYLLKETNLRVRALQALVNHGACLPAQQVTPAPLLPGQSLAERLSLQTRRHFTVGFDLESAEINTPQQLMAALAACLKRNARGEIVGIDAEKRLAVLRHYVLETSDEKVTGTRLLKRLTAGTVVITTHGLDRRSVTQSASHPQNVSEFTPSLAALPPINLFLAVLGRYTAAISAECATLETWVNSVGVDFANRHYDGLALPGGIQNGVACVEAAQTQGDIKLRSIARASTGIRVGQCATTQTLFAGVPDTGFITKMMKPSIAELEAMQVAGLIHPEILAYFRARADKEQGAYNAVSFEALGLVISNLHRLEVDPGVFAQMIPRAGQVPQQLEAVNRIYYKAFVRSIDTVIQPQIWKFSHEFYLGILVTLFQAMPDIALRSARDREMFDNTSNAQKFSLYLTAAAKQIAACILDHITQNPVIYLPSQLNGCESWSGEQIAEAWLSLVRIDPIKFCIEANVSLIEYARLFEMRPDELKRLTVKLNQAMQEVFKEYIDMMDIRLPATADYLSALIETERRNKGFSFEAKAVLGAEPLAEPVPVGEFERRCGEQVQSIAVAPRAARAAPVQVVGVVPLDRAGQPTLDAPLAPVQNRGPYFGALLLERPESVRPDLLAMVATASSRIAPPAMAAARSLDPVENLMASLHATPGAIVAANGGMNYAAFAALRGAQAPQLAPARPPVDRFSGATATAPSLYPTLPPIVFYGAAASAQGARAAAAPLAQPGAMALGSSAAGAYAAFSTTPLAAAALAQRQENQYDLSHQGAAVLGDLMDQSQLQADPSNPLESMAIPQGSRQDREFLVDWLRRAQIRSEIVQVSSAQTGIRIFASVDCVRAAVTEALQALQTKAQASLW